MHKVGISTTAVSPLREMFENRLLIGIGDGGLEISARDILHLFWGILFKLQL